MEKVLVDEVASVVVLSELLDVVSVDVDTLCELDEEDAACTELTVDVELEIVVLC